MTDVLPKGIILPWASKEKPPQGWALCDGKNGTPNLEGIFLRGTTNPNEVGNTGGAESSSHEHRVVKVGPHDGNGFNGSGDCLIGLAQSASVSTVPPFYKVQYIIKL